MIEYKEISADYLHILVEEINKYNKTHSDNQLEIINVVYNSDSSMFHAVCKHISEVINERN